MPNDDLRDDALDPNIEDSNDSQDELELSNESEGSIDNEDSEDTDWKAEAAKWRAIAKRNKSKQTSQPVPQVKKEVTNAPSSGGVSREEAVLFAQGYTEDDVDQLSLVAKGADLSLKEAKEHPLFVAYLEKREGERKAQKAKLGVSRGSAVHKPKSMAGMTPEQHREHWAEKMGA